MKHKLSQDEHLQTGQSAPEGPNRVSTSSHWNKRTRFQAKPPISENPEPVFHPHQSFDPHLHLYPTISSSATESCNYTIPTNLVTDATTQLQDNFLSPADDIFSFIKNFSSESHDTTQTHIITPMNSMEVDADGNNFDLMYGDTKQFQNPEIPTEAFLAPPTESKITSDSSSSTQSSLPKYTMSSEVSRSRTRKPQSRVSKHGRSPNVAEPKFSCFPCLPVLPSKKQETDSSTQLQKPFHTSKKSSDITKTSKGQNIKNHDKIFTKLAPLFETVNKYNFEGFLLQILKDCQDVTLEDLYNLLYNGDSSNMGSPSVALECKKNTNGSFLRRERGLKLCQVVVETFKNPKHQSNFFNEEYTYNPFISQINFHEVLRTALAIKIILETVKKVDTPMENPTSLPRASIYKAYYIICQNLIAQHPTLSNCLSLQQSIILGQSRLGKLVKLIFPNLVTKRLGKRGESKFHCMGLKLNESVVHKDILDMIALEIPDLHITFGDSRMFSYRQPKPQQVIKVPKSYDNGESDTVFSNETESPEVKSDRSHFSFYQKPLYSFVDLSWKYQSCDFSPRIWKFLPSSLPRKSTWASDAMGKSLDVLKTRHIDLNPLIHNFDAGIYSDDNPDGLSRTVCHVIQTLMRASVPVEIYIHFYLTISLLVLPAVLASDQEVDRTLKRELRTSLQSSITKVGSNFVKSDSGDRIKLSNFTGILTKMIMISEMSSVHVNSSSPGIILKEIFGNIGKLGSSKLDALDGLSSLEERFLRSYILSFNAYNFDIIAEDPDMSEDDRSEAMFMVVQMFTRSLMAAAKIFQSVPLPGSSAGMQTSTQDVEQDIPHQIFRLAIEMFHDICLKNAVISKVPIRILNHIISQVLNELQNTILSGYRKRGADFSREMFKTWWVFSAMFQEYLCVISEVFAMSRILG
ncbi:hypothetical protein JCM33374_g6411 [Metschnikowia sp. JCM 33374]|nr:hypothetical protein JCM33374_g6411 [Metschnikowia sp. JCM 33374]